MTYGKSYLGWVEFGSVFSKSSAVSEVHEKFSSSYEPHHEKYLLVSLEDIVHPNEEWVICL